jgi:hypothetical protein
MSPENLSGSKVSRQVTGSIVHSIDQDEVEGFVTHINEVMKDDPDLTKRIPIETANLFDESKDGLLLR